MPNLSVAQLWSGPPVPEGAGWREDPEVARLVGLLSARRTDLETVGPELAALGSGDTASRDERLIALFGGVFQVLDAERSRIMGGIDRFARKQRALAEQIDAREEEIRQAEAAAAPDDHDALDRIDELQDALDWDIRIFRERQQSLTYVCETPVILERRVFAISRLIAAELGKE